MAIWAILKQTHTSSDPDFATKYATTLIVLCLLSWIGYEVIRLHVMHGRDDWFAVLPKVFVFWVAFCSIVKHVLYHDDAFSVRIVCLNAFYLLSILVGLTLTFLS